jgi:hypothetical protein
MRGLQGGVFPETVLQWLSQVEMQHVFIPYRVRIYGVEAL